MVARRLACSLALALCGCGGPAAPVGAIRASFTLQRADGAAIGAGVVLDLGDVRLGEHLTIDDEHGAPALTVDSLLVPGAMGPAIELRVARRRRVAYLGAQAGEPGQWRERVGLRLRAQDTAAAASVVAEAVDPTAEPLASLALWYALAPELPRTPGARREWTALNLPDGRAVAVTAEVRATTADGPTGPAVRLFMRTPATGHSVWVDAARGELLAVDDVFGLAAVRAGWQPPARPRPPLPAGVEELAVAVDTAEVALRGTLTLPAASHRPAPLLLLVHGSGPMDRDESPFMVFRALADAAAAAGWAVLRYDKRGVGESELYGRPAPTLAAFTADAAAWLDALAGRPDLRACRVVLGHSEGGMIAPMLARDRRDIDGVVLLAAPVEPLPGVLAQQLELLLHAHGLDEATVARARQQQRALFRRAARVDRARLLARGGVDDDVLDALTWLRSHIEHDPAEVLAGLRVPILGLHGESDLQVPIAQATRLRELAAAHRLALTLAVFPGRDHLLMPDGGRPGLGLLADPDRRIDPAVLARLTGWLAALPCAADPAPR